ncbi:MAG: adenylate/guanylate cyclase domain-containing protein [Spirochaetota bacterium]
MTGIWSIDVPLHTIHGEYILETSTPGQTNFLTNYEGDIIMHPSISIEIDKEKGSFFQKNVSEIEAKYQKLNPKELISQGQGVLEVSNQQNNVTIVIYQIIPEIEWILFSTFPKDTMIKAVNEKIAKAFKHMKNDELQFIDIEVNNEMQVLVSSYNDMVEVVKHHQEAKEKAHELSLQLVDSYSRFFPTNFLEQLGIGSIVDVKLGDNINRVMTVLFSDIRAFTNLSEDMSPQETFNFINSYLNRVGPKVTKFNGFIDKYIGDAIMALYPDSPQNAIDSAIEMLGELREYNVYLDNKGEHKIAIGLGIHTGNLTLGIVGESNSMEGTVISDAVNLASRMEGLTKIFGASLIVSRQTLEKIAEKEKYYYRYLGRVKVKGKKEAVEIYDLFHGDEEETIEKKMETKLDFEKALHLYFQKDFVEACELFRRVKKKNPSDLATHRYIKHSLAHI